jgi:hypothetical protein
MVYLKILSAIHTALFRIVGVLTNNELVEGSGHHLRVGTVLTFAWKD